MPMNNGNVRRSAVGVAEGTFDANFNANESLAVLGIFSGASGAGSGQGQAGRNEKAPGGEPGAVSGGRGGSALHHFEGVEAIGPCGNCRNVSFIPHSRHFSGAVIRLEKD